jgi:hypothetical protein
MRCVPPTEGDQVGERQELPAFRAALSSSILIHYLRVGKRTKPATHHWLGHHYFHLITVQ